MSAEGLWRLGRAALDGKLLKKKTVKEMLKVVDASYALGWGVTETRRKTTRISHGGDVRGFHIQMIFFPEEKLSIVLLSNVDAVPLWHLSYNIEALMLDGNPPSPMPTPVERVDEEDLQIYERTFTMPTGGRVMVTRSSSQLRASTPWSYCRADPWARRLFSWLRQRLG